MFKLPYKEFCHRAINRQGILEGIMTVWMPGRSGSPGERMQGADTSTPGKGWELMQHV